LVNSAIAVNGVPSTTFGGVSSTLAQDASNSRQARLIIVEVICVACREFRDLSFRLAAADLEEAPIVQWQEVRYRLLNDPQPMGGELEVANDFRIQRETA
jgi:hypothetical protein